MEAPFVIMAARLRKAMKALPPVPMSVSRNQISEWLEDRSVEELLLADERIREFLSSGVWSDETIHQESLRTQIYFRLWCGLDYCFSHIQHPLPESVGEDEMLADIMIVKARRDLIAWARLRFDKPPSEEKK